MDIQKEISPLLSGLGIRQVCKFEDLDAVVEAAFEKLHQEAASQGLTITSAFNMTLKYDEENQIIDMIIGVETDSKPEIKSGFVVVHEEPAPCLVVDHQGPYENLYNCYAAIHELAVAEGLQLSSKPWETYLNNPKELTSPADFKARIFWHYTQ